MQHYKLVGLTIQNKNQAAESSTEEKDLQLTGWPLEACLKPGTNYSFGLSHMFSCDNCIFDSIEV